MHFRRLFAVTLCCFALPALGAEQPARFIENERIESALGELPDA